MKRKALIVVTPAGAGLQALRGAEQDAVDWRAFLQSPEGGAWRTGEIEILRDPTKLTVEARLRAERGNNYDFVLLGFSGHGEIVQYVSGARENRMYLRHPSDFLTEKTFTLSGQRELLCADACREVSPILLKKALDESMALFSAANAADLRLLRARELFDEAIRNSPLGRTIVYSCDTNQTAWDAPSFTQVLMKDGNNMAKAMKTARVLTIKEVFDVAAPKMDGYNHPQKPVYEGGRRITHLPFAVSI